MHEPSIEFKYSLSEIISLQISSVKEIIDEFTE